MIESLLRKVKNITSVNPNLTSLKSHDIEIDWRKSLHNKTDSIMHCITSVHVHGINSNLSIEVPNNSENGQSIQVHRENCFQSHEFVLNYKYKNETYFRQKIISMTFQYLHLNYFVICRCLTFTKCKPKEIIEIISKHYRETVKVTTNMIEKLRCDFTKMSKEGQNLFALLISIVIVIAFTSTFLFVLYCFWYRQ